MKRKLLLITIILLTTALFPCQFTGTASGTETALKAAAGLQVHFLDVGQGDAALIMCDGEAMLIDGGPAVASQFLFSYLRQHVEELDVVVATHPHDDHIGGLPAALNAMPVGVIYSPVTEWDSIYW